MIKEIIDLTYHIEEGMTTFSSPWHPLVSIKQLGKHGAEGRETRKLELGTHTGTHIDAPLHFVKNGNSIEKILLDTLIGEVTIVDLSYLGENGVLTLEILENTPTTKRMLFKFGWGKHWASSAFYRNYPFFSQDAAEYLIKKKVELVAMDTPSPDDSHISLRGKNLGTKADSPLHKLFLRNDVVLVEYIANLENVSDYQGWNIAAMPLKIRGADGSPARVCLFR